MKTNKIKKKGNFIDNDRIIQKYIFYNNYDNKYFFPKIIFTPSTNIIKVNSNSYIRYDNQLVVLYYDDTEDNNNSFKLIVTSTNCIIFKYYYPFKPVYKRSNFNKILKINCKNLYYNCLTYFIQLNKCMYSNDKYVIIVNNNDYFLFFNNYTWSKDLLKYLKNYALKSYTDKIELNMLLYEMEYFGVNFYNRVSFFSNDKINYNAGAYKHRDILQLKTFFLKYSVTDSIFDRLIMFKINIKELNNYSIFKENKIKYYNF